MARATPSSFTFRLSCGCLAILPGVQANKEGFVTSKKKAQILCMKCRNGVTIIRRYPPPYASCARESWVTDAKGVMRHVRCCLEDKHGGEHEDTIIGLRFSPPGKLASGGDGNTQRA